MNRPGVWQVSEGSGEQGKMEKTGCKITCGAPTTLAVKGLIMMVKPGQPQRIISGLRKTIYERTNKAEIRPEELSKKAESCRENLWNAIQLKVP